MVAVAGAWSAVHKALQMITRNLSQFQLAPKFVAAQVRSEI